MVSVCGTGLGSNEMESIKLVAFKGQFCHFKVFCFSFGQKCPQKATNLILSISNEMKRILLRVGGGALDLVVS